MNFCFGILRHNSSLMSVSKTHVQYGVKATAPADVTPKMWKMVVQRLRPNICIQVAAMLLFTTAAHLV